MQMVKNPHVFMDISIDGVPQERMTIELYANVVPNTVENFRALCTGEMGVGESTKKQLWYKGSTFHRIVKGFVAQGGDFSSGNGLGGESIFGPTFPDENFILSHDEPGILSMAKAGPKCCNSQFFITLKPLPTLNRKYVALGKVIGGTNVLKQLDEVGTANGQPDREVKIINCGEMPDTNEKKACRKRNKRKKQYPGSSSGGSSSDSESDLSRDKHRQKRSKSSKKGKYKPTEKKGTRRAVGVQAMIQPAGVQGVMAVVIPSVPSIKVEGEREQSLC